MKKIETKEEKLEAIRKYVQEYDPDDGVYGGLTREEDRFVSGPAYDWMYEYILELKWEIKRLTKTDT